MRLHSFVIIFISISFLLVSLGIYKNYEDDRRVLSRYISDWSDSSYIQLEGAIADTLNKRKQKQIQTILDRGISTRPYLNTLSFSFNTKEYLYSSYRSLRKQKISEDYIEPSGGIFNSLLEGKTHFRFPMRYFDNSEKKRAYLYMEMNPDYISTKLQEHALEMIKEMALYFFTFVLLMFTLFYLFMASPLRKITNSIKENRIQKKSYFIRELDLLNQTIFSNFTRLNRQEKEIRAALEYEKYLEDILRTVADINQLLIVSQSSEELLQKACTRLAAHGDYALTWVGFVNEDRLECDYASKDPTNYLAGGLDISLDPKSDTVHGPAARSVIENRTIIIDIDAKESGFAPWQERAEKSGFHACIALPLRKNVHSNPLGSLLIYTKNTEGFDPKEVAMLEELSGDIGFATQAFKQEKLLQDQLTLDTLTELPNRASLFKELSNEHDFMIVDIDRFKDINEVYGFEVGDFVLSSFAHSLRAFIAPYPPITLYKMGANTFAMSFEKGHDIDIPHLVNALIHYTNALVYHYKEIELHLSITIGFAPASEKSVEHAEMALTKAKSKKENYIVFDPSLLMNEEHENNILWQKRIKEAISEDRIVPYFQGIIDNKTQKIVKYEALMRLITPEGEVISPYRFLDISKKTRIYPQLTKIIIQKSIEAFEHREESVSINLSLEDIVNPDIVDFMREIISTHHIGERLIFEILETEGIENYTQVTAFISEFKALGCRFSIDDFGSGYSSFEHILKLNIDYLKIDGSLIKNISSDKNSELIVKHINSFAQDMELETIAEFVSDEAIFKIVETLGINYSQGYHFHEPSAKLD